MFPSAAVSRAAGATKRRELTRVLKGRGSARTTQQTVLQKESRSEEETIGKLIPDREIRQVQEGTAPLTRRVPPFIHGKKSYAGEKMLWCFAKADRRHESSRCARMHRRRGGAPEKSTHSRFRPTRKQGLDKGRHRKKNPRLATSRTQPGGRKIAKGTESLPLQRKGVRP